MNEKTCPMCQKHPMVIGRRGFCEVQCGLCISAQFGCRLAESPRMVHDYRPILGAVRELNDSRGRDIQVVSDGNDSAVVSCIYDENQPRHVVHRFPATIPEKASKLLASLVRQSRTFGESIPLELQKDYPLAYATDVDEAFAFLRYLAEQQFVRFENGNLPTLEGHISVSVTAAGYAANDSNRLLKPLTVFISSTCYDLKDARAELADHLERLGNRVLMSDDPTRFDVAPDRDSIQSCLFNVEKSDLVICLIDQRYGPPLGTESHPTQSATQAEIMHARKLGKHIFYCIRKEAFQEYAQLRRDPNAKTLWVEPKNDANRNSWLQFVTECISLPNAKGSRSNWADQFSTSVDLKKIVAARIRLMQEGIAPLTD